MSPDPTELARRASDSRVIVHLRNVVTMVRTLALVHEHAL